MHVYFAFIIIVLLLLLFLGVLVSHPSSRDVHIHNFSLTFHGAELLSDTHLELNTGRRYGLLGLNGSGRSTCSTRLPCRYVVLDHNHASA